MVWAVTVFFRNATGVAGMHKDYSSAISLVQSQVRGYRYKAWCLI